MKRIIQFFIVVALWSGAGQPSAFAKEKNPSVKRYMNAAGTLTPKRHKKAINNYTHTKPARATKSTTRYVAKRYQVISGLALKNPYEKGKRIKLLVARPKPNEPQPIAGQ